MFKVLVSDRIADSGIKILEMESDMGVDVRVGLSLHELKKIIGEYDALVVRSSTAVTWEIIEAASRLKVIGRAGTGIDNIDLEAATERGIVVMNTPEANTVAAAEHAVSMMLSMARRIPQACASMKEGKWEKKRFMGVEIHGKTLGILGVGRIGSLVAKMALGLGMKVMASDPYLSAKAAKEMGVALTDVDTLLDEADFISIHASLTHETRNMVSRKAFKRMKEGVMIVNCARGGIVDEEALYEAIAVGKVAGAALDVYAHEPPPLDYRLLKLDEVICTPHLGASTREAQEVVAIAIVQQIIDYLKQGMVRNAVNVPSIKPELIPKAGPYIHLAQKLGSFIAQIFEGRMEELAVEYAGEVLEEGIYPALTFAALAGLLRPILGNGVNMVNASVIAKQRGIKVVESKSEQSEGYISLIRLRLRGDKGETSASGTLIKSDAPRIVMVNGYPIEAEPQGYMLFFTNYDRPGVIGRIGTILGEAGVNIAGMRLGRVEPGELAIAILNVDSPIPEEVMEKVRALPNITYAKLVDLS